MEKQNERTPEFAEKAAAESSAREYELFGAAERTAKFTAYLEKVVTHAKIDYPVSYTHLDVYKRQTFCFWRSID